MSELKIFQCNYSAGRPPEVFLGVAVMAGLTQMHNTATGQPTWRTGGRPFDCGPLEGSLAISAASQYVGLSGISGTVAGALPIAVQASLMTSQAPLPPNVARISGTVTLTITAIPQGTLGTRVATAFRDSGNWEFSESEEVVDSTMRTIVGCLQAEFPENAGWWMTKGGWQHPHEFNAPEGALPDLSGSTAAEQATVFPDDIYTNPRTGRTFTAAVSTADAGVLIQAIGDVLADTWALEYTTENVEGTVGQTFDGTNRAWSSAQLSLDVIAFPAPPPQQAAMLTMLLGDLGGWASPDANEALKYTLDVTNKTLQSKFAGATLVEAES
jgi:hypothetical protein